MNFVRLGVMWQAVETEPGVFNETYLAEVDNLVRRLGKRGIYTLVDAHQDVLSKFVCGEGIPTFYARQVIQKAGNKCFNNFLDYLLYPIRN